MKALIAQDVAPVSGNFGNQALESDALQHHGLREDSEQFEGVAGIEITVSRADVCHEFAELGQVGSERSDLSFEVHQPIVATTAEVQRA